MTEQLNERERWLAWRAYLWGWESGSNGEPLAGEHEAVYVAFGRDIPPDPNLARIAELEAEVERLRGLVQVLGGQRDDAAWTMTRYEAEVERLNGLLDNLWCLLPVPLKTNEQAVEFWTAAGAILKDNNLDSRRTAERKEPTDASE